MPNKNYIKGVRKERLIVNEARAKGLISFRSAGSHSPIDVVVIDSIHKTIQFIQCKPKSMSYTKRKELESLYSSLNSSFISSFVVI